MRRHYRIEVTLRESGEVQNMDLDEKEAAMDTWDAVVDNLLPGDSAKLIDMDAGRVLSSYHPRGESI